MAFGSRPVIICLFLVLVVCGSLMVDAVPSSLEGRSESGGVHWALIVAGSSGWDNYRHQADACHAYQIMKKHGIPASRIVTMMYDDLAHNEFNPTPGIVINHPHGKDVYGGTVIDYRREDVTPKNFLAALSGRDDLLRGIGNGKVIKSGPKDHIFVNFVDHGAPGLIAFPSDELHARELMSTILSMHSEKKFAQMVFYVEACESGSMFQNLLPKNISVWATTAANARESSYACYYDSKRQTYLGDVYSVKWMEDSDKEDLNVETLQKQYQIVKSETQTSHVMEYGDMKLSKDTVSDFQSDGTGRSPEPSVLPQVPLDAVRSEYVPLSILYNRLMSTTDVDEQRQIHNSLLHLLQVGKQVDDTMTSIASLATRDERQSRRLMSARYELTAYDCYEPAVELFDERCFDVSQNDFARQKLYVLVNLCEERVPVEKIMEVIAKVCSA